MALKNNESMRWKMEKKTIIGEHYSSDGNPGKPWKSDIHCHCVMVIHRNKALRPGSAAFLHSSRWDETLFMGRGNPA